jgi:hypothetical protein
MLILCEDNYMQRLEFIEDLGDLKSLNENYLEKGWTIKDFIHGTTSGIFPAGLVLIESPTEKLL